MLDAVLELSVELGPVVALEVVRDNHCTLVFLRLALGLHCVREEVYLSGDMEGFLALRLWDLRGLIVLREDGFLSNFTELLVEVDTLLVVRLAISRVVNCVNRGDQLRGATEFILNKLLFGLLYTQASHVFSETPHRRALVRAEDSCVIIGRINSLDFDGFVAEIFKLEGQLLFNSFGVYILLTYSLGKSFGVLGGTLGRVEAGDQAGDCAKENRTVGTLVRTSGGYLVATTGTSWGSRTNARFIENCVRV